MKIEQIVDLGDRLLEKPPVEGDTSETAVKRAGFNIGVLQLMGQLAAAGEAADREQARDERS